MKKVLIVAALIFANQAFAAGPSKETVKGATKAVVTNVKSALTKKSKSNKVDWFMGTNAVTVTTGDTGCGDGGHGGGWGWGWIWKWWR